jgi:hypothetical protein
MSIKAITQVRIFNIKKPVSTLPSGGLSVMFDRNIAISEAACHFWTLNLATEAEVGDVIEHDDCFEVHIKYKELKWATG